jgi:hypothetical protein
MSSRAKHPNSLRPLFGRNKKFSRESKDLRFALVPSGSGYHL